MILIRYIQQFLYSARFALFLMFTSFVVAVLIMVNTSPLGLGPAGMLLAFVAFYVWFFSLFLGAAHVVRALRYKREEGSKRTPITGRLMTLCVAWTFAPLILLALQSIGQLEVVSVALVILFEVLISIYIIKR